MAQQVTQWDPPAKRNEAAPNKPVEAPPKRSSGLSLRSGPNGSVDDSSVHAERASSEDAERTSAGLGAEARSAAPAAVEAAGVPKRKASEIEAEHVEQLSKKRFVRERLSEGQKVARALKSQPDLELMMAPEVHDYWQTVSMIKRCNPTYFLPIYIPFIFLAMQKVKIATLKMPGEYASTLVFSVPPNLLGMLLSETGGNKSAILSFMIDCLDKYKNLMGYDGLDVTDFTLEALRGAMADNDGSCLVHMHEGKKLCSLGQYKKGGDDSVEVLMEALDGVPMRIARKGG